MARLSLDDAAWGSTWRDRSTAEKAVLSGGLAAVALTGRGPVGAALVLLAASVCACALAGVTPRAWSAALAAPVVFVALGVLGIVVTFGAAGAPLLSWGPLVVTEASALRGARVAARAVSTSAAVLLLAATTPMPHLLASLGRVRGLGVLAEIAGVVYRMLFGLLDAQASVRETQAARLGYRDARAARRSVGALGAATLIRAWTGAQRLEAGLSGRGGASVGFGAPRRRPVSRPFVAAGAALVLACALLSLLGPAW
ncbi:cobalt ECF transporter T component CbiQ [Actinosynnema pretiosum subsp. pretiosum]|uniref:Cobalt ABC transporter, inner membrane subunit CbiQ n=2 Tax=Actinosynnema TaxID=40566 RepID=C6WBR3_ACTMD|nr:cobalt ECF transporter T component CbiQ [Actinosynnema mirum]ACU37480.1 cobalt ABC transporter, inner membrane subunit CbiQ [Actinosynnema mirum DSM 43827]AXX30956.1 Transmembrane component CbiQ of energizing module of cobalt ECF transporter [Actinosynnema pretiosum subsp. pretiosum]QUF04949.1 cobalt ECF transporter T component CbiQ [Actinosynnema pretiosum subsp. pretiosum]